MQRHASRWLQSHVERGLFCLSERVASPSLEELLISWHWAEGWQDNLSRASQVTGDHKHQKETNMFQRTVLLAHAFWTLPLQIAATSQCLGLSFRRTQAPHSL